MNRSQFKIARTRTAPLFSTAIALLCTACHSGTTFETTQATIESRGVQIPITFVHPSTGVRSKVPLVVMAHGHGGTRDESGAFTSVAKALAENGVASIRMDFPGCGDSSEPFEKNNLTNMLIDVRAAYLFALQNPNIDEQRVGALGYSMGGRVALLTSAKIKFEALALWAPAASDGAGSMAAFLGGPDSYGALRSTAEADGYVSFRTRWGQDQLLGLQWFTDLESTTPLTAVRDFAGSLMVIQGERDDVINPMVAKLVVKSAANSSNVVTKYVPAADHGLGFYDEDRSTADQVVEATALFLALHLQEGLNSGSN